MFCKSKCSKVEQTPWITIDLGEKNHLINIKNITLVSLEDKKIKFSMCDGTSAELDTQSPEDAKQTFSNIANVIYSKS